jgi:hypothetical protein
MYHAAAELKKSYKRVTLYTLFVSTENTHLLRNHLFEAKRARSGKQWAEWFREHLREVHENGVLPGIALRTGKTWAVAQIIGWIGNAKHTIDNTKVVKRRNKTKLKGRKNG